MSAREIQAHLAKLEEEVQRQADASTQLSDWINNSLKPGLANLKSAIKSRLDSFEEDLDVERNKTQELARWIKENIGTKREILADFVKQEVEKEVQKALRDARSEWERDLDRLVQQKLGSDANKPPSTKQTESRMSPNVPRKQDSSSLFEFEDSRPSFGAQRGRGRGRGRGGRNLARQSMPPSSSTNDLFSRVDAALEQSRSPTSMRKQSQEQRSSSSGGPSSSSAPPGSAASSSGPSLAKAVDQVRSDNCDTTWFWYQYDPQLNEVVYHSHGSGDHAEFVSHAEATKIQYGMIRLLFGADAESKRVKFIFVLWVGPSVKNITKAKSNTHKINVEKQIPFHVEIRAEDYDDMSLETIHRKLRAAGGANYGAQQGGYQSRTSNIKQRALEAYTRKESEGNIKGIVYEKSALPKSTPCDIKGRPMVAAPADAAKNINYQGNLNLDKWKSNDTSDTGSGSSRWDDLDEPDFGW